MRSIALVVLAAAGLVAAQNYTINPNNVDLGTRSSWCQGQQNTCNTLCANSPKANSCDPGTLDYSCLCQNNSAPGLQYYLQTMPTFECNEAFKECNDANVGNAAGQANCTNTIQKTCGTLDPNKADVGSGSASSSSSSASGTATPTTGSSASGSTSAPTTSSSHGAAPTNFQAYGSGAAAVAVGLFAYLL